MTWRDYQRLITRYDRSPGTIEYYTLGLCGEAGEIAEKVKKSLRDNPIPLTKEDITKELGDVLWYLTALASAFDIPLSWVAEANLIKLEDRKQRGVLQGNGDNR